MSIEVGKFNAGVVTRQVSRWEFLVLEQLDYMDSEHGLRSVPVGFVSDLASIRFLRDVCRWCAWTALTGAPFAAQFPWVTGLLWLVALGCLSLYAIFAGYSMRASILHDWEYSLGELSRSECDALYKRAQNKGDGTAKWRAWIAWAGVRLGGWKYYKSAK